MPIGDIVFITSSGFSQKHPPFTSRCLVGSSALYEKLIQQVCSLERAAVIERLSNFPGDLRLDFSPEFLHSCETERLRHLLLAALWRCGMKELATEA